jgi:hypothetical protein
MFREIVTFPIEVAFNCLVATGGTVRSRGLVTFVIFLLFKLAAIGI